MQGSHSSFWILSVFRKVLMCTAWLTGIFTLCSPLDLFRRQLNAHGMVCTVYKYMCGPEEHKQMGCWHLKKPLDYWAAASACTHSSSFTGAGTLNNLLLLVVDPKPTSVHIYSKKRQSPCLAQLTIHATDVMQKLGYWGLLVGDTKAVK